MEAYLITPLAYGQSEFPCISIPDLSILTPRSFVESAGTLIPNVETKLVSLVEEGKEITTAGSLGRLLLRGPMAMSGYFNNAEATRRVIDADGWIDTGGCRLGHAIMP